MFIFDLLQTYHAKWQEKSVKNFSVEEIAAVEEAIVVPSDYGNSVKFTMKTGGYKYIPLSVNSTAVVGEVIDLSKAQLVTLSQEGHDDIYRVMI